MDPRPCLRCKGTKERTSLIHPEKNEACYVCNGEGFWPAPDETAIQTAILCKQGRNKGKLKSAYPSPLRNEGLAPIYNYYVWRLARFHGGQDVTMPMTAGMLADGCPFRKELDDLADKVAKESFGSNMRAVGTWGRALGYDIPRDPNDPLGDLLG